VAPTGTESAAKPASGSEPTAVQQDPAPPVADRAWRRWSKRRLQKNQSISLTVLATLAVIASLYIARAILLPIMLALLFALTLRPVIRALEKKRIPAWLGAIGVLLVVLTLFGLGAFGLVEPAQYWIQEAPERMEAVSAKLTGVRESLNEFYEVSEKIEDMAKGEPEASEQKHSKGEALTEQESGMLERLSRAVTGAETQLPTEGDEVEPEPVEVQVTQPRLMSNLMILNSAGNYLGSVGLMLVLGFFLLAQGDVLLNNVLHVIPSFSDKKNTVRLVYSIESGISRYLLTVTTINLCLGVAIGSAMWLLDVPNPALWGLMGALLNFIPYIGALIGVVVVALVAVVSFDSLTYAAAVPLVYFMLTAIEGNFITPHFVGRSASLNPVAVVLALVFWGWMWGVLGALIGVPLLIIFKIACDHFERMHSVGTLLEG
jgi:predicted PurR-regulated permease PerM